MIPQALQARINAENDAMSYHIRRLQWCEFWQERSGASFQPEIDYHRAKMKEHWSNVIGWSAK